MTYTYSYSGADCKAYAWFEGSSDHYESLSKKNLNIKQPMSFTTRSEVKRKEYAKKYPDMEKPVAPIESELKLLDKINFSSNKELSEYKRIVILQKSNIDSLYQKITTSVFLIYDKSHYENSINSLIDVITDLETINMEDTEVKLTNIFNTLTQGNNLYNLNIDLSAIISKYDLNKFKENILEGLSKLNNATENEISNTIIFIKNKLESYIINNIVLYFDLLNSNIDTYNIKINEVIKKYEDDYKKYQDLLAKYNTQIEYDVTDEYEEYAGGVQESNETLYDNQLFEWLNNPVHLNSLATISLSVHDAKAPVRRLGHVGVSGFTKSIRTIAGTMVFLIIEDHPLRNLIARDPSNVDMNYYYFSLDKEKGRGNFGSETTTSFYSSSKLSSLISKFNLMLRYQTEVYKRPDMLDREALNVFGSKALFFEPKELNGRASMIIKGIEITGESLVTSVNDMVTEVVIQFVAEDVVMFRAENTKTETDIKEAYERSVSKLPDENRKPISVSIDTDKPLSNPISTTVIGQREYIEGVGVLRDMPKAGFNLPRWDK